MQRVKTRRDSFSTLNLSFRVMVSAAISEIQFAIRTASWEWLDRGWHGGNVPKVLWAKQPPSADKLVDLKVFKDLLRCRSTENASGRSGREFIGWGLVDGSAPLFPTSR